MNFTKNILLILSLLLRISIANSQNLEIYSFDSSYFSNINNINVNSFVINSDNQIILSGNFEGYDLSANTRQPVFIKNFSNNKLTFIEDSVGFIFYDFKINASCIDENDNIYIASTVNDNKIVFKINKNNQILWAKRHGHHSFTGLDYKNGELLLTGQDEDSLGNHIILISKIDTLGNLLNSKGFNSNQSYDEAVKVKIVNDSYLICGLSLNSTLNERSLFLISLDSNFNTLWNKNLYKSGNYFNIKSVSISPTSNDIIINGLFRSTNNIDTSYYLHLDYNGNIINSKKIYKDSSQLVANTSTIDSNSNIYIGYNTINDLSEFPTLIKLKNNDSIDYVSDYRRKFGYDFIKLEHLNIQNQTIHMSGTLTNDTNNFNSKKIFHLYNPLIEDSTCLSLSTVSTSELVFSEKNSISYSNYFGTYLNHPLISTQINLIKTDTTLCEIKQIENFIKDYSNKNIQISFSNPSNNKIHYKAYNINNSPLSFKIFTLAGKQIKNISYNSNYINSSSLINGIYFISVFSNNKFLKSYKILINHNY